MEAAHAETASHPRIGCVLQGHLSEYHSNALSSHLLLDSEEVYHLTTLGYDAAQIADHTKHHLHLILVKLLELYHMGFDFAHYHENTSPVFRRSPAFGALLFWAKNLRIRN